MEHETTPLTPRACAYCGSPVPARKRQDSRFCSTSHRVLGNRKARREAAVHDSMVTRQGSEFTDHESLLAAYERTRKSGHLADPLGDVDAAVELVADDGHMDDAGTRRFLGQADTNGRRMLWKYWSAFGRRTGVQPGEQVAERVERRRASQQSSVERLERVENQVEQRHVAASRGVVARAGRASRELNSHYRRAQDTPPAGMQGPVFDMRMMPQVIRRGDRGSRAAAWPMDDGFH
jgi:hypothetical protein